MTKPRTVTTRIPSDVLVAIMSRPWRRMGEWKAPVLYEDIYCQGLVEGVPEFFPGIDGAGHFLHCAPVSYQDVVEYSGQSRAMVHRLSQSPNLLPQMIKQFSHRLDVLNSYSNPNLNATHTRSQRTARHYFLGYLSDLFDVMAYSYIFNWGKEAVVGETARLFIRSVEPGADSGEIYRSFFEPVPPAEAQWLGEERALVDLADWVTCECREALPIVRSELPRIQDVRDSFPELYRGLLSISREYGWLGVRHMISQPRTTLYYFQQLKETIAQGTQAKRTALDNIGRDSENKFKEFLAAHKLNSRVKTFLRCARELVGLSTLRVEAISRSAWAMRPVVKMLADAHHMSSRMFLDHTWKELAAKKTTSSRATLRLRARGYSYLIFGGELFLTAGREQSILMTVLNEFEQRGPVILRGQSASAGLTMGEARVIQGGRADGIRRGQVLVIEDANQLDTRWLKTAVAVVANQGGILSKAASYAREMGIPCVTGTVNATEAVRDGDLLEVDGNTGICAIRRQRPAAGTLM